MICDKKSFFLGVLSNPGSGLQGAFETEQGLRGAINRGMSSLDRSKHKPVICKKCYSIFTKRIKLTCVGESCMSHAISVWD